MNTTNHDTGSLSRERLTAGALGVALLCMLLNMADGFDLFIMGFALPHLPDDYATSNGQKGMMISFGLLGMAVGAVLLARLADRYGRRRTVLAGIAINLVGLVLSAMSPNAVMMMGTRFITGIGVGVISVVIVVAAQERAPDCYRNLVTGIVMVGFPLGSILAGLFTASLMSALGGAWQSLFWAGAVMALATLVLTVVAMPESPEFLARHDRRSAPGGVAQASAPAPPREDVRLLDPVLRSRTILLVVGYTMLSAAYYFVGTWTPQLITSATDDKAAGADVGLLVTVGTLVGAIGFAIAGLRIAAAKLALILALIGAGAVIAFAALMPGAASYMFAAILGAAVFATMSGYTAIAPACYPVHARARGYGTMMGIGRLGAIAAPIIAGFALDAGVPDRVLYLSASAVLIVVVVVTARLLPITTPRPAETATPTAAR